MAGPDWVWSDPMHFHRSRTMLCRQMEEFTITQKHNFMRQSGVLEEAETDGLVIYLSDTLVTVLNMKPENTFHRQKY